MRFLFWNLGRRPLAALVATAVQENEVDVLILAESRIGPAELLLALNKGQTRLFDRPFALNESLEFLIRFDGRFLGLVADTDHLSIRALHLPGMEPLTIAALHLPSKLWQNQTDQLLGAVEFMESVREAETRVGHDRTVLVGDFNMDPFEAGMVGASGFHGMSTQRMAERRYRSVQGRQRPYFYNPMWSLMGDQSPGPPGTYFRYSSNQVAYFWHVFDQVLLRSSLISHFRADQLRILTNVGGVDLLNPSGRPDRANASDHLPLFFALDL